MDAIRNTLIVSVIMGGSIFFSPMESNASNSFCYSAKVLLLYNTSVYYKYGPNPIQTPTLPLFWPSHVYFAMVHFDQKVTSVFDYKTNAMVDVTANIKSSNIKVANHRAALAFAKQYIVKDIKKDKYAHLRNYFVVVLTNGPSSDGDPSPEIIALRNLVLPNGTKKDVRVFIPGPLKHLGGTYTDLPFYQEIQNFPVSKIHEICNGKDDDCDGTIDEQIKRKCHTLCANGNTLTDGVQTCQKGHWNSCQAIQSIQEKCDGLDNDCNGLIDDNLKKIPCSSDCGTGFMQCTNGILALCSVRASTSELCGDSIDNDCDGIVDEGCACTTGTTQACGTAKGECIAGIRTCLNGAWSNTCVGEKKAEKEICNGKDDDCDGHIDNNVSRSCSTACGSGEEYCQNGKWGRCTAPLPKQEICWNQKDEDCDGALDNGCPCSPTEVKACPDNRFLCLTPDQCRKPKGIYCTTGIRECKNGRWTSRCIKLKGDHKPEICDGVDNDCDGFVDNLPARICQTPCGPGKQECGSGVWTKCYHEKFNTPEQCNNKDDDCDGIIDEGVSRPCYTGPEFSENVGVCRGGSQICTNGVWGSCNKQILPTVEVCDQKDNDCDGVVDETCPCTSGQVYACGRNQGECKSGIQKCINGILTTCEGSKWPQKEVCNGKDDDCDGRVDEVKIPCHMKCGMGYRYCMRGKMGRCVNLWKRHPEICGNNKDDNCDGKVDETCHCTPGTTRTCSSNVGECKTGIQMCINGQWSTYCKNGQLPVAEVCDQKDNDCDGSIDEEVCSICKKGDTRPCYTESQGTKDVGLCKSGIQKCVQGKWSQACFGQILPTSEVCDGKDNDCDGQVDENNPGGGGGCTVPQAQGPCAKGLRACVKGSIVCQSSVTPKPEVCNKIDDDCDGRIDENACPVCKEGDTRPCYTGPQGTKDVGLCKAGVELCVKGQWSKVCTGQSVPTQDLCDGQDNNCNGRTDEGIADRPCTTPCGAGKRQCLRGSWTPCLGPQPSPEVCDGVDNNCNGKIDDNAACPPGLSCQVGKCIPPILPDAGVSEPALPDEGQKEPHFSDRNVICDIQIEKDPPSSRSCSSNRDCSQSSVCRWGRCVMSCTTKQDCASSKKTTHCLAGLCVADCVVDRHCSSGFVCRTGHCVAGCRKDKECGQGERCLGFACTKKCASDSECTNESTYCSDMLYCLPRCTLTSDCPTGFACFAGKCASSCEHSKVGQACPKGQVCQSGRCTEPCDASNCPQGKCIQGKCIQACQNDSNCPSLQACHKGQCTAHCASDVDCTSKQVCVRGLCVARCQTHQDCERGAACSNGRCVFACSSQSSTQRCMSDEVCAKGMCHSKCTQAADCSPGYICVAACPTCTENICQPSCRHHSDCSRGYFCNRGLCISNCSKHTDCSNGQRCNQGQCEASCSVDTDCPLPQKCVHSICMTPKPPPAGPNPPVDSSGCGCQVTTPMHSSWFFILGIILWISRRRRKDVFSTHL